MKYNNERFCRLKDGGIEPLYYGKTNEKRNFYEENGKWYLDYDVVLGCGFAYCHSEIVEFLNTEAKPEGIVIKDPIPLKGKTRMEIARISVAKKIISSANIYYWLISNDKKETYTKEEILKTIKKWQKNIEKRYVLTKQKRGKKL